MRFSECYESLKNNLYFCSKIIYFIMPFEEGHELSTGRPKGSLNKVTKDVREAYKEFVENNVDKFQEWIEKVAQDNPAKAIELVSNLSEYFLPKLSRSEIKAEVQQIEKADLSKYKTEDLEDALSHLPRDKNSPL